MIADMDHDVLRWLLEAPTGARLVLSQFSLWAPSDDEPNHYRNDACEPRDPIADATFKYSQGHPQSSSG